MANPTENAHEQLVRSIKNLSVNESTLITREDCNEITNNLTSSLVPGVGLYGNAQAEEQYLAACQARDNQLRLAVKAQREAEEREWDEAQEAQRKVKQGKSVSAPVSIAATNIYTEEAELKARAMEIDAVEKAEAYKPKKRKKKSMQPVLDTDREQDKEWLGDYERPNFNADYIWIGPDDGKPEWLHTFFYFGEEWQAKIVGLPSP